MMMRFKKNSIIKIGILAIILLIVGIAVCYLVVSINANSKNYSDLDSIPHNKVGLLLRTSPTTPQGGHNYYFDERIKATAQLYHGGKIDHIIASGVDFSDSENGCDEPSAMRDLLIVCGIPDNVITLDYDGSTINSIFKAKAVYGLDSLTIISQEYHNERAIWLAEHYGLKAIAYNAKTPDITDKRIKNITREFLARVTMFLDLALRKRPQFLLEDKHIVCRVEQHCKKINSESQANYDVYRECLDYGNKPQSGISKSEIVGLWEMRARYTNRFLKLNDDGTYCMKLDIDSLWNPYNIEYKKCGNYTYDSITNRLTLLNHYAKHELDSADYNRYPNPRNKELIIVNLSKSHMTLFESGAYINQYIKR